MTEADGPPPISANEFNSLGAVSPEGSDYQLNKTGAEWTIPQESPYATVPESEPQEAPGRGAESTDQQSIEVTTNTPEKAGKKSVLQKMGHFVLRLVGKTDNKPPLIVQTEAQPIVSIHHPENIDTNQSDLKPENIDTNQSGLKQFADFEKPKIVVEPESTESSSELLDDQEIVERLESRHYVRIAPRFRGQSEDTTRTNVITHYTPRRVDNDPNNPPAHEMTEHEAMRGFRSFLEEYISVETEQHLADGARNLLEQLTFIGAIEYAEAARGLGLLWKSYLDGDPARKLCVLTKISTFQGEQKSDTYLFDRILETFTEDERKRYGSRILSELTDLDEHAEPERVRIVLLDDWTISGQQLSSAYSRIKNDPMFSRFAGCVELDLIASRRDRIEQGFLTYEHNPDGSPNRLPVRAYYRAHDAKTADHGAHISGSHASVDYDYDNAIRKIVERREGIAQLGGEPGGSIEQPPLTQIKRSYRLQPRIFRVSRSGIEINSI